MRKLIAVLALFLAGLAPAPAHAGVASHALAKVAKVAAAPVVHPKRSLKQVLGSVVFVVETGNDVVLGGLTGLDKAASMELKYNPFHYAAVVDGKIDVGIEKAEMYLFGSSN